MRNRLLRMVSCCEEGGCPFVSSFYFPKEGICKSESVLPLMNSNFSIINFLQTYRERLSNLDSCEFDVPVAFQLYPLVLQDVIKVRFLMVFLNIFAEFKYLPCAFRIVE